MTPLLACKQLCKHYKEASSQVDVLKGVGFSIQASEQVAILGSSGSGKSTLLHILGALDTPSDGCVEFRGEDIFAYSAKQQAQFRNKHLGFIYQFHHLLPEFSALENVAMPLLIGGENKALASQKAKHFLELVGLEHRMTHRPATLSGGERQRVAIARALVNEPAVVLADEPTGNLDERTGESIYQLICDLRTQCSTSFVIVTHDVGLASQLDRTLHLNNGQVVQNQGSV